MIIDQFFQNADANRCGTPGGFVIRLCRHHMRHGSPGSEMRGFVVVLAGGQAKQGQEEREAEHVGTPFWWKVSERWVQDVKTVSTES